MNLQIFVGWDPKEDIAWEVCKYSILRRTDNTKVTVRPIVQSEVRKKGIYWRKKDLRASTEFSLTRFLTPHLAGGEGYAVFVDCDFLFRCDILEVLSEIDLSAALSVVKHDYKPSDALKMDGRVQSVYPRKNWSSFIVFNCCHPSIKALTPKLVNTAEPSFLHQFKWLKDEEIGSLDIGWNYLEGWYPKNNPNIKAIHYTLGGPWFENKRNCDFADLWNMENKERLKEIIENKTNVQILDIVNG